MYQGKLVTLTLVDLILIGLDNILLVQDVCHFG
jgi:hypothetical protein